MEMHYTLLLLHAYTFHKIKKIRISRKNFGRMCFYIVHPLNWDNGLFLFFFSLIYLLFSTLCLQLIGLKIIFHSYIQ